MDRRTLIGRGNVVRTEYREDAEAGCYLGNGRFGAVMSGLGLNMSPAMQQKYPNQGQSQFMHMEHWGRFRFISDAMKRETTADYILPLFRIHWEKEPESVRDYRQCQEFYDGILRTDYTTEDEIRVHTVCWFDRVNKNMAGIELDISEGVLPVKVSVVTEFVPYAFLYQTLTKQSVEIEQREENWCVRIGCEETVNSRATEVWFASSAPVEACEDGLRILAGKGKNRIFISVGEPVNREDAALSLERTKKSWNAVWDNSGWFDFPEETAQKTWIRSLAYLISSYDDDCGMIQPTNGLTGNMFPFHFVQDMEYVSPALMMTGHGDIVKRWVEKFAGQIEEMRQYAKRLWPCAEGIYPPWELPYGAISGYHSPSVPVVYCYEPHNAGYLCRMAREMSEALGDAEWSRSYAWPLMEEIGRFYRAFCRKGEDRLWHLEWDPCIGQDEAGGRNKKDYLCSLYSAKYTFQSLVECGLDPEHVYAEILQDGLAFDSLRSENGTLHTACGTEHDFGKQKHPVQLDGLTYFPTQKAPLDYERKAYALRHEITARAKEPFFFGWTLGQFLLAGSNEKDAQGWLEDWALMRASDYTDSEWIQIYETSTEAEKSFYVTTHGMVLQSLIRNYVNDYWGTVEIGSCPVFSERVEFGNIYTRLGVRVSGWVQEKKGCIELAADRDCECSVNKKAIAMKRGETKRMEL